MRKILGTLMTIAAITLVMSSATDVQAEEKSTQYKLVWSDEFTGNSLNLDNWRYDIGGWGWGNNEAEYYTDREENVKVSGGYLTITARADGYEYVDKEAGGVTKTTKYTSGRINTSGKQSFKYGKIEAKIRIPDSRGMWPAFWMLGQNEPKGWPYCGEIDILETWNENQFAQGAVHWEDELNKPNKDTYRAGKTTNIEDKTQWHIYGVNWTPEKIQWTLNDQVYYQQDITSSAETELHKEFYILLNCAIGGNLAHFLPNDDFISDEMIVDYVRVYQRECDGGSLTGTWAKQDKDSVAIHNVKFKSKGKVVYTQTVLNRETLEIPTVARRGYEFLGWYYNDKKITTETRVESNMVIKAKWKKIKVGKAKITSTKQKYKKAATLKFKASKMVEGYEVKVGKKKDTTTSKVITFGPFKSKKTYSAKVRAYYTDSKGKKVYGKWSKTVKITIK